MELSKKLTIISVCIITAIIVGMVGASIALSLTRSGTYLPYTPGTENEGTHSPHFEKLSEIYALIDNFYYTEIDPDTMIQGAIDGMLATLGDPYTFYYSSEQWNTVSSSRNGDNIGIGIQVQAFDDGNIYVTRVFPGGSAYEAGIQKGDILYSANGYMLNAYTPQECTEAISHVKVPLGEVSELIVLRGEEKIEIHAEYREYIMPKTECAILEGNIGYLSIDEWFGTVNAEVNDAIALFEQNGVEGIIIDLRDNPGGYLDYVVDITDLFMPEGVIIYTEDRNGERVYYESDSECVGLPLAVLVNGSSASASEVFSIAIQKSGSGTIVGTQTYGKGIVQTTYPVSNDGDNVQMTTSRYFAADGFCLHLEGVTPDIVVEAGELTREAIITSPNPELDPQLKAAYDYLLGEIAHEKAE